MASAVDGFSSWLTNKLQELNIDENVFGSYIQGILDSDDCKEEKIEGLQGILSEIIPDENGINATCNEIFDKWEFHKPKEELLKQSSSEDVDKQLVKMLESQQLATTKQKKYTEEEKKIREAILSQYSQMTDEEDENEDTNQTTDHHHHHHREEGLEKNTNAQSVMMADKAKREQAKLDSQRKKEKDKEDREKQKQLREEKKEKRKTQKGERRR